MDSTQRRNPAKNNKLCKTCLQSNHDECNCRNRKTFTVCSKPHNTLLHIEKRFTQGKSQTASTNSTGHTNPTTPSAVSTNTTNASPKNNQVILPTTITNVLDSSDKKCQEFYEKTVKRTKEGRYIVRLHFNDKLKDHPLGESRKKAVARLLGMEAKFKRDPQLEQEYKSIMKEYEVLGHLKLRQNIKVKQRSAYYIPHHAVIKEDSSTMRLRVVFDASARSSSGLSLNEKLLTGPTLQQDLFSILLRWRKHRIAFKADIEKMYRQIQIAEEDQQFQLILWRYSHQESIKEYQLTTVTYGTKVAPYLAARTLLQLAVDEQNNYPIASAITKRDFYVDDLISGGDTVQEAKKAQRQLISMLAAGGFRLRKWASQSPNILEDLPQESIETKPFKITDRGQDVKALGIQWLPRTDAFKFSITFPNLNMSPTKRSMISESSRIFDPLGWLTPTTIVAKKMLQDLLVEGLSWDDPLPSNMSKNWVDYRVSLSTFNEVTIPRWVGYSNNTGIKEIHGFSDASENAYAAVTYFRTIDEEGKIYISLLVAKSKVASISKKVSLPRLKLNGAVLLARLIKQIHEAMQMDDVNTYAWTDSSVVLAWIKGEANKCKTFVAKRVSIIQATINSSRWHYVKSADNPADVASRGCSPKQLLTHPLWWTGPEWLQQPSYLLPNSPIEITNLEECKAKSLQVTTTEKTLFENLCAKFSSLCKLLRVIAYCGRFVRNVKFFAQIRREGSSHEKVQQEITTITTEELESARLILTMAVQEQNFVEDMDLLRKGKDLKSNSKMLALNPFLDPHGVLRVGESLKNSKLIAEQKHPIILPYKHPYTSLIIQEAHLTTSHGGIQLTLAYVRLRYWVIKGHSAVRQHVHRCVICCRQIARTGEQLMGNDPRSRAVIVRPFTNTGVDYVGPLNIRMSKGRGLQASKGYIVVFVCLSTKAMHLEAATDISAEAFMVAFKRLIGRRGPVTNMYSDSATNFTLANKIMQINAEAFETQFQHKILVECTNLGTTWHFIPPSAPNLGGLWEAGVNSVKYHLKRILKDTKLTYEELTTVLVQIEACLNSRPLCPLTSDPTELEVLTPGHFLVSSELLAPPEKDIIDNKSLQNKSQLSERLQQDFWKKWSMEYLSRLQERSKWLRKAVNMGVGQIVIIKDENQPPTRWTIGRIMKVHPENDELVRVATLKTKTNIMDRPISKLCLLPIDISESSNDSPKANLSSPTTHETEKAEDLNNQEVTGSGRVQEPLPIESPQRIDYDALLSKAYRSTRPVQKRVRVAPVSTYSCLITKAEQDEAFNQFKNRYPKTAQEIEQRKEEHEEPPRKRAAANRSSHPGFSY